MHIVFGMAADGGAHPAHPGSVLGVVGGAVLGPVGMLDLLAGRLGLSGPPIAPVVRIVAWQSKLEHAAAAAPRFYSKSLSVDALSTARLLLSWRDDLVEAGWVPSSAGGAARRVDDLAAAELSPPRLPRGRQDLMREVLASLLGGAVPDVDRVDVIEPLSLLPPAWRRLLRALADRGVVVAERRVEPETPHGGDLGRVRGFLAEGRVERLVGDGSLTMLRCRTAIMAAEALADWMAGDVAAGRETVFVLPGGDSGLIDQALARRGLPALGVSPRSPHRGALQLLSLAFSMAWAPFDPQRLLEMLLLPRPPVEPWAARLLAGALCREPGVGGPAWARAWEEVRAGLGERGVDDAEGTMAEWRAWTEVGSHARSTGIPVADAAAICDRVRRWALAADGGARDPLLLSCAGATAALARSFALLRRSPVPASQVDGMVELAIGDGVPDPTHVPEEGAPRCVTRPGAVWGRADRLVWWGFSAAEPPRRRPWTAAEASVLAAGGCELEADAEALRREAAHWEQVVRAAGDALVLATPSMDGCVEPAGHPLAQRLAPILADGGRDAVRADADALLDRGSVRLAGSVVRRPFLAGVAPPVACATWDLPSSMALAVDGRHETASSLQDLVECQLRWLLRHVARLGGDRAHAIPGRERLLGDVAHALAQSAFPIGVVPDPADVRRLAVDRIDGVVDAVAAPLRLPGAAGELALARSRIPDALASLARLLSERRLAVVALVSGRARAFGGLSVRSRIDMVVRNAEGAEAVIDLKWTRSRVRRRREIEEGRAFQLATYRSLLGPDGAAPAGYYLLRQRELLAQGGSWLAPEGLSVDRGLDETWDAVAADWATLVAEARSGRGLAVGLPAAAAHLPDGLRVPPAEDVCSFCDMRRVCRVGGGA